MPRLPPQDVAARGARRRLRTLALAVVVLLGLPVATLHPAYAADDGQLSVRLVDAPEAARDEPRARTYVVDHLAPGSRITRRLQVANGTDRPQAVELYPGPSEIVDGLWSPEAAGETSDLTSWTVLGRDRVVLQPGSSVTVPFTIEVPTDAAAGERLGVLWASVGSEGAGQVRMVSRVGVRVYLSVGPGGAPATDFTVARLVGVQLATGRFHVVTDVTNTGGRAIDLEGDLHLRDGPGGVTAGPFPALVGTSLAPGDVGQVVVDLPAGLPQGSWRATLDLAAGRTHRTVETNLLLGAAASGAQPAQSSRPDAGIPAWTWAGGIALLAMLLGLGWIRPGSGRPSRTRRALRS